MIEAMLRRTTTTTRSRAIRQTDLPDPSILSMMTSELPTWHPLESLPQRFAICNCKTMSTRSNCRKRTISLLVSWLVSASVPCLGNQLQEERNLKEFKTRWDHLMRSSCQKRVFYLLEMPWSWQMNLSMNLSNLFYLIKLYMSQSSSTTSTETSLSNLSSTANSDTLNTMLFGLVQSSSR